MCIRDSFHTKWHLLPSSRLATIDMDRKLGAAVPFLGGGSWVPIQHKVAWAEAYLHTKWHLNPSSHLAITDTGRKLGEGAVPLLGGAGSPSNTVWPGTRPTYMPSFILIHPTIWSQHINVTDRTDRQDRTNRTDRQRSDGIGRTVSQTVAKNGSPHALAPSSVVSVCDVDVL